MSIKFDLIIYVIMSFPENMFLNKLKDFNKILLHHPNLNKNYPVHFKNICIKPNIY